MTETYNDLIHKRFGQGLVHDHGAPATGIHKQQLSHRSRRRFTSDAVPDETLEVIAGLRLVGARRNQIFSKSPSSTWQTLTSERQ